MRTGEIPVVRWAAFFNARDFPLVGVPAERAAGEDDGGPIEIVLGELPDAHVVHTVTRASRVRIAEWSDAYSATVGIDSGQEGNALLHVGPEAEVLEPGLVLDGRQRNSTNPGSPPRAPPGRG